MRILFITPYPLEGASTRHRIVVYFPFLDRLNIDYRLSSFISDRFYRIVYKKGYLLTKTLFFLSALCRRFFDLLRAFRYDIVFIHLEAFPLGTLFFEKALHLINKNIIYDLDDAIFLKNVSAANSFISTLKSGEKYPKLIQMSKAIISCNDYLGEYAQKLNPRAIHQVIHTPVNIDIFVSGPRSSGKSLVLGWIGSYSTSKYIELIREPLQRLGEKFRFDLNIVGAGRVFEFKDIKVNNIDWTLEKDIENFQLLDIGIYPLPDNEWVKGKTGFKTLQYMAVGIPCVVSAVGANLKIVQDGVNGFLASTDQEWYEKLAMLIENEELRMKIGKAGRQTVVEKYSVQANFDKFMSVLDAVEN